MKLTSEQELEAIEFWGEIKLFLNDEGYPSFVDNGEWGMILWEMGESGWNAYAVTDSGREAQLYEGTENRVPDFDEILDVRTRDGEGGEDEEDDECEDFWYYDDNAQKWVLHLADEQEVQ